MNSLIVPDLCVRLNPLLHVPLAGEVDVDNLSLDFVLLLQLIGHGPQLAQSPADQHDVLSPLGQLLTYSLSCEEMLESSELTVLFEYYRFRRWLR